jgi:hypothetical protein
MGDPATFDNFNSYVGFLPSAQQTFNPGATATLNKNGSSNHTGDVIRIHTRSGIAYIGSAGPSIADTAGSKSWNIGIVSGPGVARVASTVDNGIQCQGGEMWNDGCRAIGVNDNFLADAGGVMRNFNCQGTRRATGVGSSITDYYPALAA